MWIIPNNLSSAFAADTLGSSEDLILPGLNIEQSLMWRSKPSRLRTWSQRWSRVIWFRLLCGRILKPSLHISFEDEYTASLAVIRVSPSALPDSEKAQTTHDTCGRTLQTQLELFDQSGASLKTSKDTFRWDSPQSSAIWKKWVTEQRGEYSQRKKSVLRTEEKGCHYQRKV